MIASLAHRAIIICSKSKPQTGNRQNPTIVKNQLKFEDLPFSLSAVNLLDKLLQFTNSQINNIDKYSICK